MKENYIESQSVGRLIKFNSLALIDHKIKKDQENWLKKCKLINHKIYIKF